MTEVAVKLYAALKGLLWDHCPDTYYRCPRCQEAERAIAAYETEVRNAAYQESRQ